MGLTHGGNTHGGTHRERYMHRGPYTLVHKHDGTDTRRDTYTAEIYTYRGTYTRRDTHRGDIRMKEHTYGSTYSRSGHIHGGDIHMKEQTYGEMYTW